MRHHSILQSATAQANNRSSANRTGSRRKNEDVFVQHPAIIEVGCWAHARRYFKEALPTAAIPCAQALAIIGQLYGMERAASDKHFDAPVRQRLRQEQARARLPCAWPWWFGSTICPPSSCT